MFGKMFCANICTGKIILKIKQVAVDMKYPLADKASFHLSGEYPTLQHMGFNASLSNSAIIVALDICNTSLDLFPILFPDLLFSLDAMSLNIVVTIFSERYGPLL